MRLREAAGVFPDAIRGRDVAKTQIKSKRIKVKFRLPIIGKIKRISAGSKQESPSLISGPKQRLYSKTVTGQHKLVFRSVPERKSEHADKHIQGFFHAKDRKGKQQGFSIRTAFGKDAQICKFGPNFRHIVNFAIIADCETAIRSGHRLRAKGRKIADCQPAMAKGKMRPPVNPDAAAVRAAPVQALSHAIN